GRQSRARGGIRDGQLSTETDERLLENARRAAGVHRLSLAASVRMATSLRRPSGDAPWYPCRRGGGSGRLLGALALLLLAGALRLVALARLLLFVDGRGCLGFFLV